MTAERSSLRSITEPAMQVPSWVFTQLGIMPNDITHTGLIADVIGTIAINMSKYIVVDPSLSQQLMQYGTTLRLTGLSCDMADGALKRYRDKKKLQNDPNGAIVDFDADRRQEIAVFLINGVFALLNQEYLRAAMDVLMARFTLEPSRLRAEIEKRGYGTKEDVVGSRPWRVGLSFLESISKDELATFFSVSNLILNRIAVFSRQKELNTLAGEGQNSSDKREKAEMKISASNELAKFVDPISYYGLLVISLLSFASR